MSVLITNAQREQLLKNGEEQREAQARGEHIDFEPVVKLFALGRNCIWLLTFLYPADPDVAFGLCDLGVGDPEPGDVRLSEITAQYVVMRDTGYVPSKKLHGYAKDAYEVGCIVT